MVSVRWDFGDGMSSNWLAVARGSCTTSVAHAFWSGGEFAIRCTVRDQHGASNSSYAVALVDSSNRPPVAMIAVAGATGPVVHLPGMTVDVDLDGLHSTDDWTAVGAMTFDWREDVANPAGPLLSPHARTQRSLRITDFPLPGVYRIHLVVNDGEYNSAPATVEFRVPGLSGLVRSENESMLPLYGVQLCVTNRATGRVDIESTDFDGWCALDTGEGDNIEIALERNGARKCAVTSVDQSGSVGRTLTFPAPLCAFSACVSAYTNATAYAPLPYAGVEIIVGNEIAFAGSADLDGGIAVGDVPELWPLGPTVNYQVRYQKPGYESALLPLQVDRNCVTWHRPALHPASAITATGIVVGLSSMPVEGASVELGAAFPTVMTGPDGRFVCAGIMPGAYLARMTAPGFVPSFATVSILDGQEPQQLTIRGGTFSVHGGVYDAYSPGHPVSNVLVSVLDSRGAPLAYAWSSDIGYYDITVVRGARRLRYDADGYEPQIIPLDVQSHVRQDVFLETPEPAAAYAVLAFILARRSAKSK
ncbi:carboxypeptidase regulatory-like domain-containing protein [bacterium]|nr:carboxypeptidase regulatory-like domain-containing protein [bacterium]